MESGTDTTARTRAPRKGERLEVEIDSLAFGGRGVARADGFVVFVAGGLPGDRVLAEVTKGKKRFAEARTVELLRAGADRLPDRCVHGGEPCPGAPWQGLAYERQLAEKQAQVEDSLRRIGGLREKTVAARRAGCTDIIFPKDCMSDWLELPGTIKEGIVGHPVEWYGQVFDLVFSDVDRVAANKSRVLKDKDGEKGKEDEE